MADEQERPDQAGGGAPQTGGRETPSGGYAAADGRDSRAQERPLREPRPVWRPPVDQGTATVFRRPPGVSGAIDPAARSAAGGTVEPRISLRPPTDPVHAQVFGKPDGVGSDGMLERMPGHAAGSTVPGDAASAAAEEQRLLSELADPWRDPDSPVGAGTPAVAAQSAPPVLDLVGRTTRRGESSRDAAAESSASRRLTVRETFFGRRLSWQAMAALGACVAAIALVGGVAGNYLAASTQSLTSNDVRLREAPPAEFAADNVIGEVADNVQPAVVNIQVTDANGMGEGSGIVIDDRGYILTNNHVVTMEGAAADDAVIEVVFPTGQRAEAQIVGTDPKTDLAVIKVDVQNPTVAQLGDSDEVEVGQQVIAIGSPLGLPKTVTQGIVSATNRAIALGGDSSEGGEVIDAIQTDTAINPGNSGGPLVDTRGAVIGINTLIFTQSGGSDGLGFAIPINEARRIAEALIRDGEVTHPAIGVNARTAVNGSLDGAEVVNVQADGPAERGGLREGDVVVQVGEREIHSADELVVAVRNAPAGEETTLTVVRDGNRVELKVTPEAR